MPSRAVALFLSGVALVAVTLPAGAIEAEPAAQALAAALTGDSKAKVSFDSARDEGGNIRIEGLSVADGDGDGTVRFANAVIQAPTEGGNGIFETPSITFSDGAISGKSKGSIAAATLTGVTVLDPEEVKETGPGKGLLFATAEARDLKIARNNQPGEVTVARVFVEVRNVVDNVPQDSRGTVEDIILPPEFFAEGKFKPQAIGYDKLTLDVSWDGLRDLAAKTMTIRDFKLSLQDGGDFSVTGIMGNLPEPSQLNDPNASSKAGATEVHTMTIRYDDKSLAGRVMDMLAAQQGITREAYAEQIAGAMPFLLAALNNPEFQNEVAGALGAFLKDPQSLTLKLEPTAPVSGQDIMGIMQSSPQTLPDKLNASVTANTAE